MLSLEKRILAFSENIEKLAQRLLKNGEDLVNKEKFTVELKTKFDTQGKRLENIGQKFNIGKHFGIIGDKMGSIGNRVGGHDGSRLNEYAGNLKNLGGKISLKGGSIEKLGVELQKLEPNV